MEVRKEQRQESVNGASFRITVKIFHYLVSLIYVVVDNGVSQLKAIKLLAYPYLSLHDVGSYPPVILWQRNQNLIQLRRKTGKIRAHVVSYHLRSFRFHGGFPGFKIILYKGRQFPVFRFGALKHHANGSRLAHYFLALVYRAILMANHQDGRLHGTVQVTLYRFPALEVLRLFHYNHPVFRHHGIFPAKVGHLDSRDISAEHHRLVKVPHLWSHHVVGDIIRYLVYIIRLLAHQQIDGRELSRFQRLHQ